MRPAARWSEAWRNAVCGAARAGAVSLAAMLVCCTLSALDLATSRQLDLEARDFVTRGASTLVFTAPDRIDTTLCLRLGNQPGVTAVGATRSALETTAIAAPGSTLPVRETTPGFLRVLGLAPAPDSHGVAVSAQAATVSGARAGQELVLTSGRVHVDQVYDYPDDGRIPGLGFAVLVPTSSSEPFDACWVNQWPQTATMQALIRGTLVPGTADQAPAPTLAQLNPVLGQRLDARSAFQHRVSRWAPLASLVFCAGLAGAGMRSRRLALASALHAGVTRADLVRIVVLESMVAAVPVLVTGAALALLHALTGPSTDFWSALALGATVPVAGSTGIYLGAVLVALGVKESHLFAYFKQR